MPLIEVGRLGRPHGLTGETTLDGSPLAPADLLAAGTFVWEGARGDKRTLTLESVRGVPPRLLVRFAGFADRDGVAALTNGRLSVERSQLPDPGPGQAYVFELIGLEVHADDGRRLGILEDVLTTAGANPVYVIRGEREWLLPATAEVVRRVDLEARRITVAVPSGLEDL
jgi:16S rRNA processing protein RimM